MKTIKTRGKDGKIFGLFVRPEEGELLTTEQLGQLLPYVLHVVKKNASIAIVEKITSKLVVSGQSLSFHDLSEIDAQNVSKLLDVVISSCDSLIKEVLIVPQSIGDGLTIRHRVMHFKATEDNTIAVKYTELGAFNNLDAAMKELAICYPEVEVTKTQESTLTM